MAVTYSVDRSARTAFLHYQRNPRFDEWETAMKSLLNDAAYEPGFHILLDRSLVDEAPDTEYVRRVISFIKHNESRFSRSRWVAVVRNKANYGMERMAQLLSDGTCVEMSVFTDRIAAENWLKSMR
jgi:hypothetical protein